MPDATVLEAGKSLLSAGPIGAILVLTIGALVFTFRMGREDLRREQEAHQKTRDALIAAMQKTSDLGESVRDQMKDLATIVKASVDYMKEQGRQ